MLIKGIKTVDKIREVINGQISNYTQTLFEYIDFMIVIIAVTKEHILFL